MSTSVHSYGQYIKAESDTDSLRNGLVKTELVSYL